MSDFTFTSTAECSICGEYLSSSDEDCDHDGNQVDKHVFRRIGGGRDDIIGVKSTVLHKWRRLYDKVGDDWIAYQYLGTREHVNLLLHDHDNVSDIPMMMMAPDAPNDIGESKD